MSRPDPARALAAIRAQHYITDSQRARRRRNRLGLFAHALAFALIALILVEMH